jgi:uncharacterized protein (DUF2249 family)
MSGVQHSSGSVVDVRSIVPRERHPLISLDSAAVDWSWER